MLDFFGYGSKSQQTEGVAQPRRDPDPLATGSPVPLTLVELGLASSAAHEARIKSDNACQQDRQAQQDRDLAVDDACERDGCERRRTACGALTRTPAQNLAAPHRPSTSNARQC